MSQATRPRRVTAIGMDERMRNTLRLFFQGPCKNRCVLVEEESAEIGIIDLDGYQGQTLCDVYRIRHPEQPIILISLHEIEADDAISLRKPLKAKELLEALKQTQEYLPKQTQSTSATESSSATNPEQNKPAQTIKSEVPGSDIDQKPIKRDKPKAPTTHHAANFLDEQNSKILIGTAPDIDPSDTQLLLKAQYRPEDFLQSHLTQACDRADAKNCNIKIETPRGSIYLFPHDQSVLIEFSESQLRALSSIPVSDSSISIKPLANYAPVDINAELHISRDALLWKTSLWASRGRIPVHTSMDTPIYLRRWPNMTRLPLFPHSLRIAALWIEQPHALIDTARVLDIPQRNVFGFYSAAHALGLASTGQRAVDNLTETQTPKKNHHQGLFGRILQHLKKSR